MTDHMDRSPVSASMPVPQSFHRKLLDSTSDGNEHSLKSFLERPIVISSGPWTTSAIAGQVLTSIAFPEDLIKNTGVYSGKIKGFLGFRATLCVRLQVNSNKMQQGRCMLTFFPGDNQTIAKGYTIANDLFMRTQLPRVEYDLATDSAVIMEIPYVSPFLCYDTTQGQGHSGVVHLVVYSPLVVSTSETDVTYTVWANFKDIELLYPTKPNPTFVAQSGQGKKMRKMRVGNPSVQEEDFGGFLSKPLSKVSTAAGILSEVPLLSSVAGPVSWFSGALANAAHAFGFSNPLASTQVQPVVQKLFSKSANCDGADQSHNFGLIENNQLEHLPGFAGQDVDEMALAYPLSISTYFQTFNWASSAAQDAALTSIALRPDAFVNATAEGGRSTTPVSYFSNFFSLYRGSLTFKFKFVKTEFHSGRLLAVFTPGWYTTPGTLDQTNFSYNHREIIDIRETTEVQFTCPYSSVKPWRHVYEQYGTLTIFVLNGLRNPDTVANNINIIVEVAAAPDFEFAQPRTDGDVPYLLANTPDHVAAQAGSGRKDRVMRAQAGDAIVKDESQSLIVHNSTGGIGTAKVLGDTEHIAARHCTGEVVKSVRQLVKKSTPYIRYTSSGTAGSWKLSMYPFCLNLPVYNVGQSTPKWQKPWGYANAAVYWMPDMISCMSVCYAYQRGSVRLRGYYESGNCTQDYRLTLTSKSVPTASSYVDTTVDYSDKFLCSNIPVVGTVYPVFEASIPYYNTLPMVNTPLDNLDDNNAQKVYNAGYDRPTTFLNISKDHPASLNVIYYLRQAGEDFSLGFWTGSPRLAPLATVGTLPAFP